MPYGVTSSFAQIVKSFPASVKEVWVRVADKDMAGAIPVCSTVDSVKDYVKTLNNLLKSNGVGLSVTGIVTTQEFHYGFRNVRCGSIADPSGLLAVIKQAGFKSGYIGANLPDADKNFYEAYEPLPPGLASHPTYTGSFPCDMPGFSSICCKCACSSTGYHDCANSIDSCTPATVVSTKKSHASWDHLGFDHRHKHHHPSKRVGGSTSLGTTYGGALASRWKALGSNPRHVPMIASTGGGYYSNGDCQIRGEEVPNAVRAFQSKVGSGVDLAFYG